MDSKLSRVKLTTVVVGDNSRFCRSKIQEVTVTEVGTLLSLLLNGHFAKTYLDYFQTVFMGDACFDRASLHKVTFAKVTFVGKVNFGGATLTAVRFVDCIFKDSVSWDFVKGGKDVRFENVLFEGGVSYERSSLAKVLISMPSAESSPLKLSDDLQSMIDATDKIAVDEDMPVEASEEDEASDDEYYYEYDDVGEDLDEDNYADENEGDEVEEATGGDEEL
uniref:Uncharacterized protein n=1 Tax=Rhodosorus marinus TaxID=101924 RepID=A0A7S2ZTT5_9RHOD|mmetsp:Transcript_31591/g.122336  ORF Transcript_31591/g.122336 Transcript_31591/m.122336 type:complete len:221 (+) Transcript_31591:199-861(+)